MPSVIAQREAAQKKLWPLLTRNLLRLTMTDLGADDENSFRNAEKCASPRFNLDRQKSAVLLLLLLPRSPLHSTTIVRIPNCQLMIFEGTAQSFKSARSTTTATIDSRQSSQDEKIGDSAPRYGREGIKRRATVASVTRRLQLLDCITVPSTSTTKGFF